MGIHSEDLRVKVVEFIKKGHANKEAAEIFGVSLRAISQWKRMDKEGKRLVFKHVPRSPHRINHEELLAYVKEHPDAYLREISAHFSLGVKYKKTNNLSRIRSEKAEKIYRISKKTTKK